MRQTAVWVVAEMGAVGFELESDKEENFMSMDI
jgi:hypothetical protein